MKKFIAVVTANVDMNIDGAEVSVKIKHPIDILAIPVENPFDYEPYYTVIFPTPTCHLCDEMFEYGNLKEFIMDTLLTVYDEVISLEEVK